MKRERINYNISDCYDLINGEMYLIDGFCVEDSWELNKQRDFISSYRSRAYIAELERELEND